MPIGSLTSQFFANVYLNELDQFVKHSLKVRGYIRYVDDFVLLADDPQTLLAHKARIEAFLHQRLGLQLHPTKTVLQRCNQGADFLGAIVHPHHRLSRQRAVRALRRRLHWFRGRVFPHDTHRPLRSPVAAGNAGRPTIRPCMPTGTPPPRCMQRMLATLNSYYGVYGHANTWRLRKHIYEHELGPLKTFFLPDGPSTCTFGSARHGCLEQEERTAAGG